MHNSHWRQSSFAVARSIGLLLSSMGLIATIFVAAASTKPLRTWPTADVSIGPTGNTSKKRKIALCYIRQSMTRDGKDMLSPERQEKYIQDYLDQHPDLDALWFRDVDGHRSGRSEKGRPDFQLLLEEWLNNSEVEAVIVTEFSRLSRSVFTSAKMIELLHSRHNKLVFAYTQQEADVETSHGRMHLHLQSLLDEYYADFVSMTTSIAIAAKRAKGQWVGECPFATYQKNGVLKLDKRHGAWCLPDGSFQLGKPRQPPTPGAVFRTYAGTLRETYTRYSAGIGGADAIALSLNQDGWPFEDGQGQPCPVTREHVRTLLAEWPAYGGNYQLGRAKARAGYQELDPDTLQLNTQRAVLNLGLIRLVAAQRKQRGLEPSPDHGMNAEAHPLPLAQLIRCAACEAIANRLADPHRQTRLGGTNKANGQGYYRHRGDVDCGGHRPLVRQEILDERFVRQVLSQLNPNPKAFAVFLQAAHQADGYAQVERRGQPDPEQERLHKLERCKEQLRRLDKQYRQLVITEREYYPQRQGLLAQRHQLETLVISEVLVDFKLADFPPLLQSPATLWYRLDMAGQRALAHGLFEYLLYDYDTNQFTDWSLSAWAQQLFIFDEPLTAPE